MWGEGKRGSGEKGKRLKHKTLESSLISLCLVSKVPEFPVIFKCDPYGLFLRLFMKFFLDFSYLFQRNVFSFIACQP